MQNPLELSHYWLREIVIGLDLCPFAKIPFEEGLIRVVCCEESSEDNQLDFFLMELEHLNENDSDQISTTLIVYPQGYEDFSQFNDFVGELQELLEEADLGNVFQLVGFHPDFMFAGTSPDAIENLVNRSPFPTIHILRSKEFNLQLVHGKNSGESVSMMNEAKLKNLNLDTLKLLFFYLYQSRE